MAFVPSPMTVEKTSYLQAYTVHANDFEGSVVPEDILEDSSSRLTIYPIKYPTIWKNYQKQLECNWVANEVQFNKDIEHWRTALTDDDRNFLMHVLAFFAGADGIVNINIGENLIGAVKIKEAECAYGKQFSMENVHGESYSIMLDTFVEDENLKARLFDSVRTMPCIKKKAEWAFRWIESDTSYAHKLIAFSVVEGVFFSGSFASIFWLKTRPGSIMPGLRKANKFIARDERLHVDLAVQLYLLLNNRLRESVVHQIIDEAIAIELEFITEALPCRLLGMNSDAMSDYVKYCADRLLVDLGYSKKYHKENPFDFMNKIDSYCKGNFFEERNDVYTDADVEFPFVFGFTQRC